MTKNIISIVAVLALAAGYYKLHKIDQQKIEDYALVAKHAQLATSTVMEVINPILVSGEVNPNVTHKQAVVGVEKITTIMEMLAKNDKVSDRDNILHGESFFKFSAYTLTSLKDFSEKLAKNESVTDEAIAICESQKFNNEENWQLIGIDSTSVISNKSLAQLCSVVTKIALKHPAKPEPKFEPFDDN